MIHTRKMMLVPFDGGDQCARQEGGQQPLEIPPVAAPAGSLTALDKEMHDILNSKSGSDFEKWTLYEQVLMKFLNKIKHSKQQQPLKEEEATDEEPQPTTSVFKTEPVVVRMDAEDILAYLDSLKSRSSAYARVILSLLEKSSGIDWDEKGNVSIEGERTDSKIQDLLKATVTRNQSILPKGWEVYTSFLKKINIPKEYILNKPSLIRSPILTRHATKKKAIKWVPYKK
jgi:hypothetical protein